jgi:hypothetical protein
MSIIAAGTTTTTALSSTGNTDGTLQLQVNGTTPSVTLNTLGAIGVGASPSYGTSGQVLTSGGSTVAPAWVTVAAPSTSGGATVTNPMSANITLTSSSNRVQLMTPSASGYTITLPDATTISAAGGPIFILKNTTKYYPIKVLDSAGTNIAWVVSDYDTEIFLTSTASATGNWVIETHNPCANGGIYPYDADVSLVTVQIAGAFVQGVGLSPTAAIMSTGAPSGGNTRYYSTVSMQQPLTKYKGQSNTSTAGQASNLATTFLLRLSDTSTLHLYNNGSAALYGRVCTWSTSGAVVSAGGNTLISSSLDSGISAALLTSSTVLVMWTDTGGAIRSCVLSISGTTITVNTSYATSTTGGSSNSSLIGLQSPTLATVLTQNDNGVWILSISGTTITYPSAITLTASSLLGVFAASATTSVVIYYSTGGSTFDVYGVVITNNGSSITAGTATLLLSAGDSTLSWAVSQLNVGLGLIVPTTSRFQMQEQPYFIIGVSGGVPYIKSQGVLPKTSDMYTYVSPNSGYCLLPTTVGAQNSSTAVVYAYNAKKAVIVGAA